MRAARRERRKAARRGATSREASDVCFLTPCDKQTIDDLPQALMASSLDLLKYAFAADYSRGCKPLIKRGQFPAVMEGQGDQV